MSVEAVAVMRVVAADTGKKEKEEEEEREEEGKRKNLVCTKAPPGMIEILKPYCVWLEKTLKGPQLLESLLRLCV